MTALTTVAQSDQFDTLAKNIGSNKLGKYDRPGSVKVQAFTYTNNTGGTLADGSIIKVTKVANCLVLALSSINTSAMGASRVLDMGIQEHTDHNGATVASDIQAIFKQLDVSSAVSGKRADTDANSKALPVGLQVDGQADVLVKISGGTIPAGATVKGHLYTMST